MKEILLWLSRSLHVFRTRHEPFSSRSVSPKELACPSGRHYIVVIIVHSLNHVQLFTPPWTAAGRLCPPLSPRVWSNSCPLSQSCYLTIFFSATSFSFAFNLSQHQCFFLVSQLLAPGGQWIVALASVFPMNIQGWFPLVLIGLISLRSKGLSRVFSSNVL